MWPMWGEICWSVSESLGLLSRFCPLFLVSRWGAFSSLMSSLRGSLSRTVIPCTFFGFMAPAFLLSSLKKLSSLGSWYSGMIVALVHFPYLALPSNGGLKVHLFRAWPNLPYWKQKSESHSNWNSTQNSVPSLLVNRKLVGSWSCELMRARILKYPQAWAGSSKSMTSPKR